MSFISNYKFYAVRKLYQTSKQNLQQSTWMERAKERSIAVMMMGQVAQNPYLTLICSHDS